MHGRCSLRIQRSGQRQIAVMLGPRVDIEIGADGNDGRDVIEPLRNQHASTPPPL
jgi:hypothetical protein